MLSLVAGRARRNKVLASIRPCRTSVTEMLANAPSLSWGRIPVYAPLERTAAPGSASSLRWPTAALREKNSCVACKEQNLSGTRSVMLPAWCSLLFAASGNATASETEMVVLFSNVKVTMMRDRNHVKWRAVAE